MMQTYDHIAQSFSATRYAIWKCAGEFLDDLNKHATLLDVGCGNGKYANYRTDIAWFGCDLSRALLNIAQSKNTRIAQADATHLPFRTECFDAAISIAVLHHLKCNATRLQMLREIMRVVKTKALVTVWAREQDIKPKWQDLGQGDFLIPWQNTALRYYHLFHRHEFESLLDQLNYKYELYYEKDNWCAILYKDGQKN